MVTDPPQVRANRRAADRHGVCTERRRSPRKGVTMIRRTSAIFASLALLAAAGCHDDPPVGDAKFTGTNDVQRARAFAAASGADALLAETTAIALAALPPGGCPSVKREADKI